VDEIDKIEQPVQVRKSPAHELLNIRPTGIALVPAGANARVFVMTKSDGAQQMKLKLAPAAKSAMINAFKQALDTANGTFALITGAEEDETAETSPELVEMLKASGGAFAGMADQFGKKKPADDEDEKRKKAEVEKAAAEVAKAGRVLSQTNEDALRAAKRSIDAIIDPIDAARAAAPAGTSAPVAQAQDMNVAKVDEVALAKAFAIAVKPMFDDLKGAVAVEKGAMRAPETRVIEPANGGTPSQKTEPKALYNPNDLDTVLQKRT
jgi:hypothetical protein